MAAKSLIFCDRCGGEFNPFFQADYFILKDQISSPLVNEPLDLCRACNSQLKKWIEKYTSKINGVSNE